MGRVACNLQMFHVRFPGLLTQHLLRNAISMVLLQLPKPTTEEKNWNLPILARPLKYVTAVHSPQVLHLDHVEMSLACWCRNED